MFKIIEKKMLNPTICKMVVEAPRIARAAQPGQFLIVRADEPGERIPLTISDFNREAGTVTIVIQPIGASTRNMVENFAVGDSFADVAGPLGNPSEFVNMPEDELKAQRVVFIAGGLGTAPVYPQAKWLHEHGVSVDVIIGARTKDLLIYEEELGSVTDGLYMCTDDGSYGFKGVGNLGCGKAVRLQNPVHPILLVWFSGKFFNVDAHGAIAIAAKVGTFGCEQLVQDFRGLAETLHLLREGIQEGGVYLFEFREYIMTDAVAGYCGVAVGNIFAEGDAVFCGKTFDTGA